jgi:hypothetical protein
MYTCCGSDCQVRRSGPAPNWRRFSILKQDSGSVGSVPATSSSPSPIPSPSVSASPGFVPREYSETFERSSASGSRLASSGSFLWSDVRGTTWPITEEQWTGDSLLPPAYYVSSTGNDGNPGTIDQPWRTIHHAAETVVAGDTVYIRGGTYNEQVRIVTSGSAAEGYITFAAYRCSAHDAEVGFKMWGDNTTLTNCLSYHNKSSNLELDWDGEPSTSVARNCTFVDSQVYNIWVEHGSDSLHMYNCIVAGSDSIGLSFEQRNATNYRGDYNIFHDDDGEMAISVGYEDEFTVAQVEAGNWTAYSGQDQHSLVCSDPSSQLFENLTSWDLHLRAGSIAIDKGTADNAPSDDYDWREQTPTVSF